MGIHLSGDDRHPVSVLFKSGNVSERVGWENVGAEVGVDLKLGLAFDLAHNMVV